MIGGIIFGTIVGGWAGNLKFIGDIFIRLTQMWVVHLVMTLVISAIGKMTRSGVENQLGLKVGVLNLF